MLDPGGRDEVGRVEEAFPLTRTRYQKLFLDASTGILTADPVSQESSVRYKADDGKGRAIFTIRFEKDIELTGYLKLRLWVEAEGENDMDLFVFIQKLNKRGKVLNHMVMTLGNRLVRPAMRLAYSLGLIKMHMAFYSGPNGKLRISHRQLDTARSTPSQPYLTHTTEELLSPGQIVPVEIPILPTGMRWHAGEQLRVVVAGYDLKAPLMPNLPVAPIRNKGEHIIHTGGKYDSHLLVLVIPG